MNDSEATQKAWNLDEQNIHISNLNFVPHKAITVCIIIPTYNEVENIPKLLNILFGDVHKEKYENNNINMHVLVVDDNSPDGTARVVQEFMKNNPNIHLLSRTQKNGLGAAYVAGMQHAIEILNPDIVFEMDADLSHNPKYIFPMINKIREGADFVIGSRYVKGGSIPDNWGFTRKAISRTANTYARTMLGLKSVHDCTGGFRCIRTSALQRLDLNNLGTKGYAFQISLLENMRRIGAEIREVPIHFDDRTEGKSKMRFFDMAELAYFVFMTRFSRRAQHQKSSLKMKS